MNDRKWLAAVYSEQGRSLFLTAWNILRNSDSAEDAVQTAFANMSRLKSQPDNTKLYAFRSVRNAAIDIARANRRRPTHETLKANDAVETHRDAIGAVDYMETVLSGLSPESREVVELHIHSDLTFREIGEIMASPTQTIASRYRRALHTIREAIEVAQR